MERLILLLMVLTSQALPNPIQASTNPTTPSSDFERKVTKEEPLTTLPSCRVQPRYGAIVTLIGRASFVEGHLRVQATLNQIQDRENAIVNILRMGIEILSHIRTISHSLTYLDRMNLYKLANECTFLYFLILENMSESFIRKLGLGNREQMQDRWTTAVEDSIFNNGSIPHPLKREGLHRRMGDQANFVELERAIMGFYKSNVTRSNRTRRSWFDAGGFGLNKVFGVATETQLHAQKVKIVEAQAEIKMSIAGAKKAFKDSLHNLVGLQNELEKEFGTLENYERADRVVGQLRHVFQLLSFLYTITREIEDRRSLLLNGVVPAVISKDSLQRLIREGENGFHELNFPFKVETEAAYYEALQLLHVEPTLDPDTFTLVLPFVNQIQDSSIHRIRPFPTWTTNQSEVIWVSGIREFLMQDTESYDVLESLDYCKRFTNGFLCPNNRERRGLSTKSCELALVHTKNKEIGNLCSYSSFSGQVHALPVGEAWIVFSKEATIGNTKCAKERTERLRTYQNTFCVPKSCGLDTQTLTIHATQEDEVSLRKKVQQFPTEELANVRFRKEPRHLLEDLHKKLNKSLDRLQITHEQRYRTQQIKNQASWGAGTMIIVIVIVAFIYLGLHYSKPRARDEDHDSEEGQVMVTVNNHPAGGTEEERPVRTDESPTVVSYVRRPPDYLPMTPVPRTPAATRTAVREDQGNTLYDTLPNIYQRADEDHGYGPLRTFPERKVVIMHR